MRLRFTILIFLVLISLPVFAFANEGHLDLSMQSRLVFANEGNYIIQAKSGFSGLSYQITAKDRKGNPASGLLLVAKPCKEGLLIRIKKEPGSRGFVGVPKVTMTIGVMNDVVLKKVEGNYSISNLGGAVMGTVASGGIELHSCAGLVQLKVKRGSVTVGNHRSEGQPFALQMKQGNLSIELGKSNQPGPGIVQLDSGRLTWSLKEQVPIHFHGEVIKEGLVTCNLPITRPDPKVVTFTSLGGKTPWVIRVGKGMLNVQLPKP